MKIGVQPFLVRGFRFYVQNLGVVWLSWLNAGTLWPVLLIALGLLVIWRRAKRASS